MAIERKPAFRLPRGEDAAGTRSFISALVIPRRFFSVYTGESPFPPASFPSAARKPRARAFCQDSYDHN